MDNLARPNFDCVFSEIVKLFGEPLRASGTKCRPKGRSAMNEAETTKKGGNLSPIVFFVYVSLYCMAPIPWRKVKILIDWAIRSQAPNGREDLFYISVWHVCKMHAWHTQRERDSVYGEGPTTVRRTGQPEYTVWPHGKLCQRDK